MSLGLIPASDKGVSPKFVPPPLPPLNLYFPRHSADCLYFAERRCERCNELFRAVSPEDIEAVWIEDHRQRGKIPPLTKEHLQAIALAMAEQPELFAPIIQFLNEWRKL